MLFEIATLSGSVFTARDGKQRARAWLADARAGSTWGMWTTEHGAIGDLIMLRSFSDAEELGQERERALCSDDPFGSASAGARLTMESYASFPFLPDPVARHYGGIFEFRTYHLVPGGLPPTLAGWEQAVGPARRYTEHLVTALYALDGDLRITHLWGFSSLEERDELRREHYQAGLWPPRGGPENISRATSTIALAEPDFPLE